MIVGILTIVYFEVIDLVDGIPAYPASVDLPWGQRVKVIMSIEKYRTKFKGNNKNITIPLDHCESKPWVESSDEETKIRTSYQVLHDECDNVESKFSSKIFTGSPLSIGKTLDIEQYE